ncbi:hypothetical protein [Amycolatopsis sp. NPDC049159]|uniref:hypothetical protein n=1 Tax=Amycolatopsis sp. NPDC049159 TaxID=3157210 RepID=UPI003403B22B
MGALNAPNATLGLFPSWLWLVAVVNTRCFGDLARSADRTGVALPRQTLTMVAELIRRHRGRLRSRWRKATPAGQARVVLRHDPRRADLGGGTGVSASTMRPWVLKVIALLAARCGQAALPTSPPAAGRGSGNVSTPEA